MTQEFPHMSDPPKMTTFGGFDKHLDIFWRVQATLSSDHSLASTCYPYQHLNLFHNVMRTGSSKHRTNLLRWHLVLSDARLKLKWGSKCVKHFTSPNVCFSLVIKVVKHTFTCQWASFEELILNNYILLYCNLTTIYLHIKH